MGRFRKVDPRLWNDAKVRALSDSAKLAFLFILTHPYMTALGAMRASVAGLAGELGWPESAFRAALGEALSQGMIEHDEAASFIALPNFIKYNRPESPNVIKSWTAALDLIPECSLKERLIGRVRTVAAGLGKAFQKALPEAFALPSPNQEQEQEPEKEPEPLASRGREGRQAINKKDAETKPVRRNAPQREALPSPIPAPPPEARAGAEGWPEADVRLRQAIDAESHATWLAPARCLGLGAAGIWLELPSPFYARWIENNYAEAIRQAAMAVLGLKEEPPLYCMCEAGEA